MLMFSCSLIKYFLVVKGKRKKVKSLIGLVIFTTNFISPEIGSLLHVPGIEGPLLVDWG